MSSRTKRLEWTGHFQSKSDKGIAGKILFDTIRGRRL